jgi:hypothetical protein
MITPPVIKFDLLTSYIIFKPPDYGKRRKVISSKRFDYIVSLKENVSNRLRAIEHLKPHIFEIWILGQDESFSVFTVNMDFIIVPGADLVSVLAPPVSKGNFQTWIKPACCAHILKGFLGSIKIGNLSHGFTSKTKKAPPDKTKESLLLFDIVGLRLKLQDPFILFFQDQT